MSTIKHYKPNDELIAVNYDFSKNYMIYLLKVDYRKNDDEILFKIVDMEDDNLVVQMMISDDQRIGRLRSG